MSVNPFSEAQFETLKHHFGQLFREGDDIEENRRRPGSFLNRRISASDANT